MKFRIEKEVLINTLTITQGIISSRTNMPILSNVLIKSVSSDRLVFSATDLDIGIKVAVEAVVEEKGAISVNSRKLFEFVRELEGDYIDIWVGKNLNVHLVSNGVTAKIYGIPEEEFPSIPDIKKKDSIKLPTGVFKTMLNSVIFAASKETTRYELNGVLFEFYEDKLRLVASDGKRLSLIETAVKGADHSFILPIKAASELYRYVSSSNDAVDVHFNENMVVFSAKDIELISRVIDGEYPQYQQVIPEENKEKAIVSRAALLGALKRASVFTTYESHAVRMEFSKGVLTISKDTAEVGSTKEEMPIEYKGEEIVIGVNPAYLIDMLKQVEVDPVKMELLSPERPVVIRDAFERDAVEYSYIYLVSPMRL